VTSQGAEGGETWTLYGSYEHGLVRVRGARGLKGWRGGGGGKGRGVVWSRWVGSPRASMSLRMLVDALVQTAEGGWHINKMKLRVRHQAGNLGLLVLGATRAAVRAAEAAAGGGGSGSSEL
jgi:hypothetical protein